MTAAVSVFTENAHTVMCKRYFLRGPRFEGQINHCSHCGAYHETEDQFFTRVSMGRADYREMLESLDFLPNSPTLMNLGNPEFKGTLSACFKFDPQDTMFDGVDAIMPTLNKAAAVLKAGGGVGYALSAIRPEGAEVRSTHGKAFGPLGFLRMAHVLAKEITQGGKRDAAQMGILHCEHPDLQRFIHAKDLDPDSLGTFNISVAATDAWMRRATTRGTTEYALLDEIAQSAWKTGDPGLYFIDRAERDNPTPWLGKLTGTNPCGEVPLLSNEPCNLGSLNLANFVDAERHIDMDRLLARVDLAIEYLDDVLDANVFPHEDIDYIAYTTRKLGLGVCGWADMLAMIGLQYDSEMAVELGGDLMKQIDARAAKKSLELADVKGPAPAFKEHSVDGVRPRNATRTCIAPTGTIAILMGASSGIEPYFAEENTRQMGDGTLLKEVAWANLQHGIVRKPKTAMEIAPTWHIRHQAAFQDFTDLAVSKTINMPHSATWEDIRDAYVEMWRLGCKGGTIYRDGSRDVQVLTTTTTSNGAASVMVRPVLTIQNGDGWRDVLPAQRMGKTQKFRVGETEGFLTVNAYADGAPAEIFLKLSRGGSTLDGFADWWAQSFSLMLQMAHKSQVPFTYFTAKFKGRRFEPAGLTGDPRLPHATSIADYVARWLELEFAGPVVEASVMEVCPDCHNLALERVEGCDLCRTCGYSTC